MRSLSVLALAAILLPIALSGPVHQRHAHLHTKRTPARAGDFLVAALEALAVTEQTTGQTNGKAAGVAPLGASSSSPLQSGQVDGQGQNDTDVSLALNTATQTISYSRKFSLTTAAPTEVAPFPFSVTANSTSHLFPTATASGFSSHSASPSLSLNATQSTQSTHPTSASASSTAIPSPNANTTNTFLRGVNVGNWLVLEKWMDSDSMFTGAFEEATDQWTFDSIPGAEAKLQTHWSTYFTKGDMAALVQTGINAVRIPIGFWAYDNFDTPYLRGADAYLEQAINWAQELGMVVWIDLHGSPGSQNGFDNSGHSGTAAWQTGDNVDRSISILKTMASKYGTAAYSNVIAGLELINEPISWNGQTLQTTQQFARDAYSAVRATASAAGNPNLKIVMHDAFMPVPQNWLQLPGELNTTTTRDFQMDTHMYQVFDEPYTSLNSAGHIAAACAWSTELSSSNTALPIFPGEWSAAENICVYPDGSTVSGSACYEDGCQCTNVAIGQFNSQLKTEVGKFVEAQLDTFEANASGYFLWSWDGPGLWGFKNLIQHSMMPNPVTSRNHAPQCG